MQFWSWLAGGGRNTAVGTTRDPPWSVCSLASRLGCSPALLPHPVSYSAEPLLPAACSNRLCAAQTHKAEATCSDRERSHMHIVPCLPDKCVYLSLLIHNHASIDKCPSILRHNKHMALTPQEELLLPHHFSDEWSHGCL